MKNLKLQILAFMLLAISTNSQAKINSLKIVNETNYPILVNIEYNTASWHYSHSSEVDQQLVISPKTAKSLDFLVQHMSAKSSGFAPSIVFKHFTVRYQPSHSTTYFAKVLKPLNIANNFINDVKEYANESYNTYDLEILISSSGNSWTQFGGYGLSYKLQVKNKQLIR